MEAGCFITKAAWDRIGVLDESLGVGADTAWQSGEGTDYLLRALGEGVPVVHDPRVRLMENTAEPKDLIRAAERTRRYARGTGRVFTLRHTLGERAGLVIRSLGAVVLAILSGSKRRRVLACAALAGRVEGLRWRSEE